MNAWRMAFRAGTGGLSLWDQCHQHKLAVIQYTEVDDVNLARYCQSRRPPDWKHLSPSEKSSLDRFVYEMAPGDAIYVKEGPLIIAKGVVVGPYEFKRRCVVHAIPEVPWQHTRRVQWDPEFVSLEIQIGRNQLFVVDPIDKSDVTALESRRRIKKKSRPAKRFADEHDLEGLRTEYTGFRSRRSKRLRDRSLQRAKGVCEVCGFDYSTILDGLGVRVLQVHHKNPFANRKCESNTRLTDLSVVCANCHLLLHLDSKKVLKTEKLQGMLHDEGYLCE